MKQIRYLIFVLLFCVFPARVFVHWIPILGYPLMATGIVFVEYVCILLLILHSLSDRSLPKTSKQYKLVQILFWVYNLYIIYYVMINPVMPSEDMAQGPESNFSFIQSAITTSLVMAVVVNYQRYLNVKLFIKAAAAFMTLVLIAYTMTSDMSMYLYQKTLSGSEFDKFDIGEYGLISSLTMSEFVQMAFILNFFARDSWIRNEGLNKLIFWTSSISLLIMLLIYGQRGPVVWLTASILFYYFAKGKLGKTMIVSVFAVTLVAVIWGDAILSMFSKYDITLIERFLSIGDDGGSGRFGSDDSVYGSSFRQIMSGLLLGSNFRLTMGGYIGGYPHNFILEFLMTFGLVFSLPLFWIIWKGIKKTYYAVKGNAPLAVFCMLFLNTYLYHLTSFTVVNDTKMWILLAMTLCAETGVEASQCTVYSKKSSLQLYGQN